LSADGSKRVVARLAGAGLLVACGGIHLDLYLTGYRTIPTIGWLFLLQVVTAFGLAFLIVVTRSTMVQATGAGFLASTLGGYLLSLRFSLFGFREVRTEAGIVAGVIEVVGFALLASLAVAPAQQARPADRSTHGPRRLAAVEQRLPAARWSVAALTAVAALLFGVAVAVTNPPSNHFAGALLKVATVHGEKVITNAQGLTLYWFVPDSPDKSTCYSTCAAYWPPVTGTPTAGPGVDGTLGTIRRAGGTMQATYDGHPLYTYIGDSGPGQATGNNIDLNGGVWHEMAASR